MENKFKKIEEQEKVIDVESSAIVSASAGSGKTSVMIRKIMKYLLSGECTTQNILALTFTNLAAGEMKDRLASELEREVERNGNFELLNQIDYLPQADISTFHSFYEKIVKKYFYVAKISPSFKIANEETLQQFKEQAFKKSIENLKNENPEKYFELLDVLGKKRSDNAIKQRIFMIDEFLSSQFNPEKWLDEIALSMENNKEETLSIFFSDIFASMNSSMKKLDNVLESAKDNNEIKLVQYINSCQSLLSGLQITNYKDLYEKLIYDFSFPQLKSSLAMPKTENFFKVKAIKDSFMENVKSLRASNLGSFEIIISSFSSCKENLEILIELYRQFKKELFEIKKQKFEFDFSDLEQLCYEILQNEEVRNEIKKSYKKIFVDEFQDINPMQSEILKLIQNDNVLYVGDAKQSIYSFRQSDVDIFIEKCKEFAERDEFEELKLNVNFRTNKKILDFNNEVFNCLMTQNTCGIDYKNTSQFKGESENFCDLASVRIVGIEEPEDKIVVPNSVRKVFDFSTKSKSGLEAKVVACEIGKLLKQNINVGGEQRQINFGDICILLRSRSKFLGQLETVFNEFEIPYVVNSEFNLLDSKEVRILISILNLALNEKDDMNLVPIMLSQFGGFSYDELAEIKLNSDGEFFHERCKNYFEKNNNLISQKLGNLYKLIKDLRFEINLFGVKNALENLIIETNYYDKILFAENGTQRINFVKQFLKHIEETNLNYDFVNLISYLSSVGEIKVSTIHKKTENCVQITTIHSSKGLEYPVVILADAGRNFLKKRVQTADLEVDKKFGLAIKNYDKSERKFYNSIFNQIIKKSIKKKEIGESLRLLYVALTRAKNKLLISGTLPKCVGNFNFDEDYLSVEPTYMNYILGAIDGKKIDGTEIEFVGEENFEKEDFGREIVDCVRFKNIKFEKFQYPYESEKDFSLKTSVSEIAFQNDGFETVNFSPVDFKTKEHFEERIVPEQGIILHDILEKIDFYSRQIETDLKNIIETIDEEYFEKDYLYNLSLENIKLIKNLIPKNNINYKEKEFMTYASQREIFGNGGNEKLLIQGKIDFFSCGEKNILIDYKYTNINSDEKLINKYKKQLLSYKFAIETSTNINIDEIYILNLKKSKLLKIN